MNKNEDILFSIIIATYNRASFLSESIESIISQTYSNWELIIIDDGSTDNTSEVVHSYNDKRIKYFYKKNEERSVARNFGIDKANGEYVSFLDDDDYYYSTFLEIFYKEITRNNKPVSAFMCYEFVQEGEIRTKNHYPTDFLDKPIRLLWSIQTSIRPFAIHRDILEKEKFKIECKYGQDFHLAVRIAISYDVYIIKRYLSVNVVHSGQGTYSKFTNNYRRNAELSIICIDDLIDKYNDILTNKIPKKELYHLHNHKVYGFASAAMKHCDFSFLFSLFNKLSFKADLYKTSYYGLSLMFRLPLYFIKCLIKGNNEKK